MNPGGISSNPSRGYRRPSQLPDGHLPPAYRWLVPAPRGHPLPRLGCPPEPTLAGDLRRYLPDAAVDLVYLDPPFNSNRDYNVIFRDESGNATDAQLLAFEDTWHWGPSAEVTYAYLTNTARHEGRVPDKVSTIIAAQRAGIGENQMMAYLVEMAVRLVELHRVLTGRTCPAAMRSRP